MASAFGHAILASAIGFHWNSVKKRKLISLGILSSILPDADIIAFKFGIPYSHMFGHRGFTHSIFFAIVWSLLLQQLFYKKEIKKSMVLLYLFICTVSHGILDAMTTGGRGIAFFAPFSDERMFLPWRVIQVSPLNASDFFGEWGQLVIKSELCWIGIPSLLILIIPIIWKYVKCYSLKS
jgi:inner membrane protein